jgi:DNA-directed RNA polymerase specialized sigma24 family protein
LSLASLATNPVDTIIDALDLQEWLAELPPEDVELLALRAEGNTLGDIAEMLSWSIQDVCFRARQLGRELAMRAELPFNNVRRGRKSKTQMSQDTQETRT